MRRDLVFVVVLTLFSIISCQTEQYYTINTTVNPIDAGTISVSPSGSSVLDGTLVTFVAQPKGDYVFAGWTGVLSGTDNPKTVTVTSDLAVTANFVLREYPLSIIVEGEGTVSEHVISSKADYSSGTVVELTAKASDHWLFDHWEGDLNGNTNPVQIIVASAKSVKAVFVPKMYDLTVEVEGEGSVSEAVLKTKSGSYQEGTTVELTANPGTGWSFDHWEGDLDGNANPNQIVVSGKKSLTAVFTKNKYAYNLKIVGPGIVDEYLVERTKADLGYGAKVLLKAIPAKGAVFKGWAGDLSGDNTEVKVEIMEDMEVTALFALDEDYYKRPLVELYQPSSMTKRLFYGLNFSGLSYFPTGFIAVDYDRDGFVDVITCHGDYGGNGRLPMVFYKGPYFTMDEKNCGKYLSPLGIRKSFTGDFNNDGIIDICLVGHGNEDFPDPKDYPIFLFGKVDGTFEYIGVEECWGYHHGSAAGDFDNDGDLDVFLTGDYPELCIMVNDGAGHFTYTPELINCDVVDGSTYTSEFFDINHDGFLDLVLGGHEHEGREWHQYTNTTCIFWGNGKTYNNNNYLRTPRFKDGFGVTLDYLFYDLDGDGQEEIINARTGDGLSQPSYRGWALQIISYDGVSFTDVTDSFISNHENGDTEGDALVWIDMEEINGEKFLCGRFKTNAELLYSLRDGKLNRVHKEKYQTLDAGYFIDSEVRTMRQGWQKYESLIYGFQDGLDLSKLVSEDYSLEMYIQNTDPSLTFDYHFDLFSVLQPNGDCRMYGTGTDMKSMKNDGTWERLCILLKQFVLWGDGDQENYWNKVDQFVLITTSEGGKEFSVRDIRIRKILLE